eukprot:3205409-Pyramimonas_sp.AAC.1
MPRCSCEGRVRPELGQADRRPQPGLAAGQYHSLSACRPAGLGQNCCTPGRSQLPRTMLSMLLIRGAQPRAAETCE